MAKNSLNSASQAEKFMIGNIEVETLPTDMLIQVFVLTPELALYLLENQPYNRYVSSHHVDELASEMVSGNWSYKTADGLAFNRQSLMTNGQHRCLAVIKNKLSVPVVGIFNVDDVFDMARPRSLSDAMKILYQEEQFHREYSAIFKMLFPQGSLSILKDFYEKYFEQLLFVHNLFRTKSKGTSQCPITTAIFKASFYESDELLSRFCGVLQAQIVPVEADSAAAKLREFSLISLKNGSQYRSELHNRALNAIRLFCQRQKCLSLRAISSNPYPFPPPSSKLLNTSK